MSIDEFKRLMDEAGSEWNLEATPETVLEHVRTTPGYMWKLYQYVAWFENIIKNAELSIKKRESDVWVEAADKFEKKPTVEDLKRLVKSDPVIYEQQKQINGAEQEKARASGLIRCLEKKCSLLPGLQGWSNRL